MKKIKNKKRSLPANLTLHKLIVSLSMWGSSSRLMLVGFAALIVSLIRIIGDIGSITFAEAANSIEMVTLTIGVVALLDIGYVTISRSLRLDDTVDMLVLLIADLAIACTYIVPQVAYVATNKLVLMVWIPLVILFLLLIRLVVGFSKLIKS